MNDVASVPKVVLRREIAAPAKELFDAWLDPASLAVWMRPGGTPRTTAKVDPRVGGAFEIVMHTASGPVPHTGTYKEIDRPRRLAFTWNSPHAGQNDSLVTVEFRPARGATEIVLTHERLPSQEAVAKHTKGWSDILELLAESYREVRSTA
ncbi:MAG: SRPBCC domain-containing protein [Steroidobacteraceae bacterium]